MKRLIVLLSIIAVMAFSLIGCGNKEAADTNGTDGQSATTAPDSAAGSGDTQAEDTQGEDTPAEATQAPEPDDTQDTAEVPVYPRTYVDMAGREVVLEKEPVKISISYLPHWETLLMLGIQPIATTYAEKYAAEWDALQGVDLGEYVNLGDTEVNLELLASLEPDLILEQVADVNSVNVENYEKIAPVAVFGEKVKMDWRFALREIAKVVGREQKAEEVIAEVDAKLAESRTKLQERYDGKTIILMSIMGEDRYYCAYRPDLYDKETGLGLNVPEGYPTEETYIQVSMEALVAMNPDYIFVNVFDGSEALLDGLNENSVWQSLKAVKDGHFYRLDGSGHAASALSTVYTVNFITDTLLENQ